MKPEGVLESCLYGANLDAMEDFFGRVLGLDVVTKEVGRHVFFRCGNTMVLVFDPTVTSSKLTTVNGAMVPLSGTQGAGHLAFRVAATDLPAWRQQLRAHAVVIESEVRWPQGGESIYFRDPAGNSIELVTPQVWGIG